MARTLTPARVAVGALLVAAVAAAILFVAPSKGYYLFLPDPAHPLAPIVSIQGEHHVDRPGGIYFVDVRFRKARLIERFFSPLRPANTTLVRVSDVRPPGVSEHQQEQADLADMAQSQKIAAGVALHRLGYRVPGLADGVLVAQIVRKAPARNILRKGDTIVRANGRRIRTTRDLHVVLAGRQPGTLVRVVFRRGGSLRTATIRTIRDPEDPSRTILGIVAGLHIRLPLKIHFDTSGVGGPSAGLAFALDVMEELGRNVDRGYKIAATGELEPDGTVDPIGGVKQKTVGAREAGVDVFVVPAGDNARIARLHAGKLRVIAVKSFPQALRALATLPAKRSKSS